MAAKRTPPPGYVPQSPLPHEPAREGGQAYGKEVEDYTIGVASPPEEQIERRTERKTKKTNPSRG
jgi:hypothetical protein